MKVGVMHTGYLGDLACLGLLIEGLSREKHDVVLFTNTVGKKLYESDERVGKIVTVHKGKGLQKLKHISLIARGIKSEQLEVLLVPHRSSTSALIAFLSGVKARIGFRSVMKNNFFTATHDYLISHHESLRCLSLAPSWLMGSENRSALESLARPVLAANAELKNFSENYPSFLLSAAPYFIIAPGSVWKTKRYPAKYLAQVVVTLLKKSKNLRCVVSGGPSDEEDVTSFFQNLDRLLSLEDQIPLEGVTGNLRARVIDASRCLPISEMITLSAAAAFVLSNDSGPLHIASGVNTPVIGIYGPTPTDTGFGPASTLSKVVSYNGVNVSQLDCQPCSKHGGNVCPQGHHRCMLELYPENIVNAVEQLVPGFF